VKNFTGDKFKPPDSGRLFLCVPNMFDSLGVEAIGTVNIDREGNVSGKFDFTVALVGFVPDTSDPRL
jgi:hypothetical protein